MADVSVKPYIASEHFHLISSWWSSHNGKPLDFYLTSDLGAVAYSGDKPVVSAFLYSPAGTALAQIGWVVSNPKASMRERVAGMSSVIEFLSGVAKDAGAVHVIVQSDRSGLTKMAMKLGFTKWRPHEILVKTVAEADHEL